MTQRRRLKIAPVLETVEPRLLLSNITSLMASRPAAVRSGAAATALSAASPNGFTPSSESVAVPENQGAQGVNLALSPTGTLTPQEQRREQFVGVFSGPYVIGPGQTSTEWQQISIRGSGGTTSILHGDLQMKIVVPNDPNTPISAVSSIFDRNINSNSSLGFDMTAPQVVDGKSVNLDSAGRPNHLSQISIDVNSSSGAYDEAYSQGVADIRYIPSKKHAPGVISQGTAIVKFRAQIYSPGVSYILANSALNPGGPSQSGVGRKPVS